MPNIMLAERAAVMRPVQLALDFVQLYCEPRAMGALNLRAQVAKQRLDLAPVKVAADRFGEDRFQNALVFVTHQCTEGSRIKAESGAVPVGQQREFEHRAPRVLIWLAYTRHPGSGSCQ